ncbi:MAG: HAMP domain-containing protein [Firmicutes bacterium]|nr:HAMP domain-containing protein [Bacillota bacterium]
MKKAMNQSTLTFILNGVSIFALFFMIVSLILYSGVSSRLNSANEERFALTYNANRFMNGSAYLTNEVRAFAATGDKEHYDNYWNEVNNLKNRDIGVATMQEIGITTEEQSMIDEMSSLSNALVPLEDEAMSNVQAGHMEDAIEYVYGAEYSTSIAKINSLKEQFLETLDSRTSSKVETLKNEANLIQAFMICALVMIGAMQILSMFVIKKRILHPVIAVRDQMEEISRGNLSADFPLESDTSEIGMLVESIHETKRELKKYINDIDDKLSNMAKGNMSLTVGNDYRGEFLPIQNAMRQILDSLNAALFQINSTAEKVSEESEKMASSAKVLSEGAVQQASTVQELSAGIQEISSQVDSTSDDAENARECSSEASKQLELCGQKMEELTKAIGDISESSRKISGIIKTIEDIAFQTNILALNASVEAARAGAAGKGFAVVADEVQSLASKSSESAKNITELIETSVNLVKYGATLSEETTKALSLVVSSAGRSEEMVERIAESATQQAESLRQLTAGMEQISNVVQTNATTATDSANMAGTLYDESEELKVSVKKFRLRM